MSHRTAETSQFAYVAHKDEGNVSRQQLLLLNYLRLNRSASLSRSDLAHILGLRLQSVCGRINELKNDGLVIEDAPRRCPRSGRLVKPVRVAPDLLDRLQERAG